MKRMSIGEINKERDERLKALGYRISFNFPTGYAYKEFRDYKYQGDGWTKYASTAHGLYLMTDDEFEAELLLLPDKEKQAQKELDEFIEKAKTELSIKEGKNKQENDDIESDRVVFNSLITDLKSITETTVFKSRKYNQLIKPLSTLIEDLANTKTTP